MVDTNLRVGDRVQGVVCSDRWGVDTMWNGHWGTVHSIRNDEYDFNIDFDVASDPSVSIGGVTAMYAYEIAFRYRVVIEDDPDVAAYNALTQEQRVSIAAETVENNQDEAQASPIYSEGQRVRVHVHGDRGIGTIVPLRWGDTEFDYSVELDEDDSYIPVYESELTPLTFEVGARVMVNDPYNLIEHGKCGTIAMQGVKDPGSWYVKLDPGSHDFGPWKNMDVSKPIRFSESNLVLI